MVGSGEGQETRAIFRDLLIRIWTNVASCGSDDMTPKVRDGVSATKDTEMIEDTSCRALEERRERAMRLWQMGNK
jgi:hypothetical protein